MDEGLGGGDEGDGARDDGDQCLGLHIGLPDRNNEYGGSLLLFAPTDPFWRLGFLDYL